MLRSWTLALALLQLHICNAQLFTQYAPLYAGSSQSDVFTSPDQLKFYFVPAHPCATTIALAVLNGSLCSSAPYLYVSSQGFASNVTCSSSATCLASTNNATTNAVTAPPVSVSYSASIATPPGLYVGVKSSAGGGGACTFQLNVSSSCTRKPGFFSSQSIASNAYTYFYVPEQACATTFSVTTSGSSSWVDLTFSTAPFASGTDNSPSNAFLTSFNVRTSTGTRAVTITAAAFAHRDVADLFRGIYVAIYGISTSTYTLSISSSCASSCTYTTSSCSFQTGCGACSSTLTNFCSRCLPGTSGSTLLPLASLTWSLSRTTCPANVYTGASGCNPWASMLVSPVDSTSGFVTLTTAATSPCVFPFNGFPANKIFVYQSQVYSQPIASAAYLVASISPTQIGSSALVNTSIYISQYACSIAFETAKANYIPALPPSPAPSPSPSPSRSSSSSSGSGSFLGIFFGAFFGVTVLVAALVFWLRKRMVAQGSRLEEAIAESLSQAAPSATGNQVTMVPVNAQHHASPPHHQYTDMNHTPYGPPHSVVPTAPMPPTLAPQPHQQQHAAPVPVFHAPTAYMPPSSSGGGDWLCGMCEHRNAAHCRSCDSCDAPKAKALAAAHALPPAMHAPQHAQPTYDHPATFEPGQGYGAQPFQMPHYSDAAPPPRYSVGAPPPDFQTPASAPPPPAYQF